jgi:glycosyltransferase involved in cell wall biosynthesis
MRVLVPNHFPLEGSGSGIYTKNLARVLVAAGHEVFVIVPEHTPQQGQDISIHSIIFSDGKNENPQLDFNFPCFTTHPRSSTTFYELTDDQIAQYVHAWDQALDEVIAEFKPDIVHAHHIWVAPFVASQKGLPYVISCHGTDLMGYQKGPRYRDMATTAANRSEGIIAISRQVMQESIELFDLAEGKVELIWNGFDSSVFRVMPEVASAEVLKTYGIAATGGPIVSFVGKFTDFKGIDVLLEATKLVESEAPTTQTVLVGDGALMEEMQSLSSDLGLMRTAFLGHQPQERVSQIYNIAEVSVVPSRVEPFGLVAVEALACGTPVVATNEGGLPDFITEEVGRLVPVNDPIALAEAILAEIQEGTKKSKGEFASQYALENFTWKAAVSKMTDLYQRALAH